MGQLLLFHGSVRIDRRLPDANDYCTDLAGGAGGAMSFGACGVRQQWSVPLHNFALLQADQASCQCGSDFIITLVAPVACENAPSITPAAAQFLPCGNSSETAPRFVRRKFLHP